jgi:uncharacterized protein YjiS (DUF1127 family)
VTARTWSRPASVAHAPWLIAAFDLILEWIERAKQRTQLAELDRSSLHDLGFSEADIDAECRKQFWQR